MTKKIKVKDWDLIIYLIAILSLVISGITFILLDIKNPVVLACLVYVLVFVISNHYKLTYIYKALLEKDKND